MNALTGQRTFCLGLSGLGIANDTQTVDVPFVDSSGNNIRCNYVKVATARPVGTSTAGILVELSGVSHVGDAVLNSLSALTSTPNTSGVCGFGVLASYLAEGTGEWHGLGGDVASGLRLVITGAATTTFVMITYGNVLPLNHIRAGQNIDMGS